MGFEPTRTVTSSSGFQDPHLNSSDVQRSPPSAAFRHAFGMTRRFHLGQRIGRVSCDYLATGRRDHLSSSRPRLSARSPRVWDAARILPLPDLRRRPRPYTQFQRAEGFMPVRPETAALGPGAHLAASTRASGSSDSPGSTTGRRAEGWSLGSRATAALVFIACPSPSRTPAAHRRSMSFTHMAGHALLAKARTASLAECQGLGRDVRGDYERVGGQILRDLVSRAHW